VAETLASWLLSLFGVYLALGVVFAVPFVIRGAGRIDPAAREGSWGFRLLIFPGTVALWPLLARRWLSGVEAPPEEKNLHRRTAARRAESARGAP
jgi:hypothetical protein